MLRMLKATGASPVIDRVLPIPEMHEGFQLMIDGALTGKLVINTSEEHSLCPQQQ